MQSGSIVRHLLTPGSLLSYSAEPRHRESQTSRARSYVEFSAGLRRLSAPIPVSKTTDDQDVLVLPRRVVPRLTDLRSEEVSELFLAVQSVGRTIEKAYKAEALTISLQVKIHSAHQSHTGINAYVSLLNADLIQDGLAAGQSVPHVHVHILPRSSTGPFSDNKDDMYPALEAAEEAMQDDLRQQTGPGSQGGLAVPKDEDRLPRSASQMQKEAEWLMTFF